MDEKKVCAKCGTEFTGNFCPNCRLAMRDVCPRCKTELKGDEKFCPNCGKTLKAGNIVGSLKVRVQSLFKRIRKGFTPKVAIITAVAVVLIVALGVGLGICIPMAKSPFKEERLEALALGMTKEQVKAIFADTSKIKNINSNNWQILDDDADELYTHIHDTADRLGTNFNSVAADEEKEHLNELSNLEYKYLYIKFVNNEVVEIIYDTAHKHSSSTASALYSATAETALNVAKFSTSREKEVKDYSLTRDELVKGSVLEYAEIGCKVTFTDGSFYIGYVDGYVQNNIVRAEKVVYSNAWFSQEITINVVEELTNSCPGHRLDSNCNCMICVEALHLNSADCHCLRCGMENHTYNAELKCTVCNSVNLDVVKAGMQEDGYFIIGDSMYFGYYPQTQVTDEAIIEVLNDSSQLWHSYQYYKDGQPHDYMQYKDVTFNEEQYRGVYFVEYRPSYTGASTNTSGDSTQDEHGYYQGFKYWFKYEPIKWTILKEEDGKALIFSDLLLDAQCFYTEATGTNRGTEDNPIYENNYAESYIREWLNETFYNLAFSDSQKALIEKTLVDNSLETTGDSYNDFTCEDTLDNVFLLSCSEIRTAEYGFDSDYKNDVNREKKLSDYALSQGAYERTQVNDNGVYWLRSPHDSEQNVESYYAHYVVDTGGIECKYRVWNSLFGVAPALTINLN